MTRITSNASAATSATAVTGSRSISTSSEWLTSKIGLTNSDPEKDSNDLLLSKLRVAEAERDAALVELSRLRRQISHSLMLPDTRADASENGIRLQTELEGAPTHQVSLKRLQHTGHPQSLYQRIIVHGPC